MTKVRSAAFTKRELKTDPLESIRILVEGGAEEEILGDSCIFEASTGDENVSTYIQRHTLLEEPLFPEKCLIAARKLL
ncbi:hypothetical protein BPOR_0220g00170 [Botrytis porri]|uniref:Uncharacterized protein n=1 Tax=Botrytis porri TaxID=87229 RepID=A0A4Z1KTG9_9HELO|nr:hypothetical protein BPOR_0220g00170 [Botrytis porri]